MANDPKGTPAPEVKPEDIEAARQKAASDATKATAASAAEIVDICASAGVATMASSLIREGLSVEDARARASSAKDVTAACELAVKDKAEAATMAAGFIAKGSSITDVRAALFEKVITAQSPEIASHHQAGPADENAEAEAFVSQVVAMHRGVNPSKQKAH